MSPERREKEFLPRVAERFVSFFGFLFLFSPFFLRRGRKERFHNHKALLQLWQIYTGHQLGILENTLPLLVHLLNFAYHQSLWKISAQPRGDDDISDNHLIGSKKIFQLTSVLSFSFDDGLGTGPLDNGIDGTVVIGEEKNDGIMGSGLQDLTDHPCRRDHSHSLFHPIPFPFINGDALKPRRGVLTNHFSPNHRRRLFLSKLEKFSQAFIG